MKTFNKKILIIVFFLISQLFYKNLTAKNIGISDNSLEITLKCISNCDNISVHTEYIGEKSYSYNSGKCCCFWSGRCPTRYNIYYTKRWGYGDVSADKYTYGAWGDWFEREQWDCMGKWTRCWKAKMWSFRPRCIWNSGYGYKKIYDMPYLKERLSWSAITVDLVHEKSKEYCRTKTTYSKECYRSCFAKLDLVVNDIVVKSIDEFINALTKEQAVNALVKKIGTKGMLEYYDPNKIY